MILEQNSSVFSPAEASLIMDVVNESYLFTQTFAISLKL